MERLLHLCFFLYEKRVNYSPPNKTSTSKSAEYDAHDYDDPEDLYEDHYDDFYDYEDAEDYWEENN